jgi:hypothetical protein
MISVRLRALGLIFAAAPVAGLLIGSPAQAATTTPLPTVKSVSVSKKALTLGSSSRSCASVAFTAVLSAPMPSGADYAFSGVGVDLFAPGDDADDPTYGNAFAEVGKTSTYKGTVKVCGNSGAGTYKADVYGAVVPNDATSDDDFQTTNTVHTSLTVKRPTTLSLDASPEPVKKGKKITAAGYLKADGKVLSGASVKIYFEASGSKTYAYKGTAKTSSKGKYSKTFTATKTGTWKAVYSGSTTRNSANAWDAVKVK